MVARPSQDILYRTSRSPSRNGRSPSIPTSVSSLRSHDSDMSSPLQPRPDRRGPLMKKPNNGVASGGRTLLRDGLHTSRLPWLDGKPSSIRKTSPASSPKVPGSQAPSSKSASSSDLAAAPRKPSSKRSSTLPLRSRDVSNTSLPLAPKKSGAANTKNRSTAAALPPEVSKIADQKAVDDSNNNGFGDAELRRAGSQSDASKTLGNAISELEQLMTEAVEVAKGAADTGHADAADAVLEEASSALQTASNISGSHTARTDSHPRELSSQLESVLESLDEEELTNDSDSDRSTSPIVRRSPVRLVLQVRPATNPVSSRASILGAESQGQISPGSNDRYPSSVIGTPPSFYFTPSQTTAAPTQHASMRDFAIPKRSSLTMGLIEKSKEELQTRRRPKMLPSSHTGGPLKVDSSSDALSPSAEADLRIKRRSTAEITPQPGIAKRHNTAVADLPDDAQEAAAGNFRPHFDDEYNHRPRHQKRRHAPGESREYRESVADGVRETRMRTDRMNSGRYRGELRLHRHRFGHHVRRQPIARKWETVRKRITATIACINTAMVGFIIGVYAGMVPRIQYVLADQHHYIIQGNVYLFVGLAISTFIFWPLPLLHGRKPYILGAFAIALPLHFPQAVIVASYRSPDDSVYRIGILLARFFTGLVLGFANVNFFTVLLDLFGASLMSSRPHQEIVAYDDVRRDGGGIGIWLGIWSWCFIASLAVGFVCGAGVINTLSPDWGFYVTIILIAFVLVLNVIAPETRSANYRRSFRVYVPEEEKARRKVARGEIKLHIFAEGPQMWYQEVGAGIVLSFRMITQKGFFIVALYLGWIYAQVVLVIVLLGALLSRYYDMQPKYVGIGVFALAVGAFLAVPLSKAGLFSRERKQGPRTDSMTFERQITWSSHLVRRVIFMLALPIAGIAYTLVSDGEKLVSLAPILFAALIGFLSNLAVAECHGIIMETFDTSDLQPGVNSKQRLQSMAENVKRRRTSYSSFPRVTAGIYVAETIGFLLAAAATGIGGIMTRSLGAQVSTGVTAGILLFLTLLLTMALWRYKSVKVIPDNAFGTRVGTGQWTAEMTDQYWKPVIVGNPSGKMRRMSLLELGGQSRWTEIRKLNKLI